LKSLIYTARDDVNTAFFGEIHSYFAGLVSEIEGKLEVEIYLAAVVASCLTGEGNTCADLREISGKKLSDIFELEEGDTDHTLPSLEEWKEKLLASKTVGRPGEYRPLILDHMERLYLYRYWQYEDRLAGMIKKMAGKTSRFYQEAPLSQEFDRLFPGELPQGEIDWQRVSSAAAMTGKITILSGGPGTGKSSTILKTVLLLMKREEEAGRRIRVALTAPTGKAAGRLKEAIGEFSGIFKEYTFPRGLSDNVQTIHRLLGPQRGSPYFRYNAERKLPFDLVVVDECSMIDLPLMCKLFEALPESSPVILLGDKDQLASIEAGAVFADICDAGKEHLHSSSLSEKIEAFSGTTLPEKMQLNKEPPLADSLFVLERSYRFTGESGIGMLSRLMKTGDARAAMDLLRGGKYPDCKYREMSVIENIAPLLGKKAVAEYGGFLESASPDEALGNFSRFRVLTALRKGPWGVESINSLIENILRRQGLLKPYGQFYHKKPLLITRNDYRNMLYNGDTGIIFRDDGELSAFFPGQDRGLRKMNINMIPDHETSFAMTIHKSQGSEFDTILLIIPPFSSPLLTRELLYTGLTRARKSVEIWGAGDILKAAIENPVRRSSGLRESLWG
jgi:exodeoxyribonuclease V alpha subunit